MTSRPTGAPAPPVTSPHNVITRRHDDYYTRAHTRNVFIVIITNKFLAVHPVNEENNQSDGLSINDIKARTEAL